MFFMRKFFQRVIATLNLFQGKQSLTIFLLAAIFALTACDDSSSAGGDGGETSAVESSSGVTLSEASAESNGSSDEKNNPSSAGTSTKSSNSNTSGNGTKSSSSSADWSWDVSKESRFNPDVDYDIMTDERDGKRYKTVTIGDQVWMAENLNYVDSAKTPSLKGESWCYNNEAANCTVGGRLYTWYAAIDWEKLATDADNPLDCRNYSIPCGLSGMVQGICPSGWHLPSHAEWNALFVAVGGQSTSVEEVYSQSPAAGKGLKSQTGWHNAGNGTDAFGFSALPVGFRDVNGGYDYDGHYAHFWSSTEINVSDVFIMEAIYSSDDAFLDRSYKTYGYPIRCVKDSE